MLSNVFRRVDTAILMDALLQCKQIAERMSYNNSLHNVNVHDVSADILNVVKTALQQLEDYYEDNEVASCGK